MAATSFLHRVELLAKLAAMAAAYYVVGRLGLLLAIPPGYATAVWPASGIALAGILLFGYRVWPGILLGSFLINLRVSLDTTSTASILNTTALAASCHGASLLVSRARILSTADVDKPGAIHRKVRCQKASGHLPRRQATHNADLPAASQTAGLVGQRHLRFAYTAQTTPLARVAG